MTELEKLDKQYIAPTYNRFPVDILNGKGSVVFDRQGKRYIDMGSGIGVTAFGISDGDWIKAVTDQLSMVQHMSNLYYTEPCARLARLLCERSGMSKVFFSNSGAESNECAIKAARKYAADKRNISQPIIITLKNSFHGRTLTTLAATGQEHYHRLFNPLTPGFEHVAAGDICQLEKALENPNVAAVMIECIQGEGGVVPLEREYVTALRQMTEQRDILLIVDEVQTGNGRTGKYFAYMNFGIEPDIVTTAKGLGGGLPIGATLLSKKVEGIFGYGDHGSTFGGNPVSCAGAVNIVSRIDEELLLSVNQKSRLIFDTLEGAKGVESVTGMGLMIGIKTVKPAADVVRECMEKGVLCLTAKDKVRLLPALNIPENTLKEALDIIKTACYF